MSDQRSFTLIELLIVTPQRPDGSGQRGKSAMPIGRQASSFTLIELLIVIGILAVLVAAIVITLNPAQLLAQARDGKRQQDLSALNQSLNTIYALDQSVSFGTSSIVYTSLPDSTTSCATWNLPSLPSGWQYNCVSTSSLQNTNGTGWIPVNFTTTGVVSLASLPIDPINTSSTGLYYTYVSGGSFQLAAHFESSKYQATQGSDAMYTVGSNLNLAPFLSGLVGWWKFDETSGTTTADSSGYNNTGIMYASTTPTYILTSSGCKAGNCGSFDGVNNYVGLGTLLVSTSTGGTLTAWVYPLSGIGSEAGIIQIGYGFGKYSMYTGGGTGLTVRLNDAGFLDYAGGMQQNLWNFISTTYSQSEQKVRFFVNGVLIKTSSYGQQINASNGGWIGVFYSLSNSAYRFKGTIDDVRIYNRALSASEIQALYNATK